MVIQCSSCDTRFKIADDKVKAEGVKVRCSKCKEVFTVMPPEEDQVTAAPSPIDTAPADDSGSLNDVDWGSLNSDEAESFDDESDEPSADISSSDFSFGGDDDASDEESLQIDDQEEESTATDDFSFDDDETSAAPVEEDTFSFGGSDDEDEPAIDEPVGEGAQDEFSFDDGPAATGDVDDFDWDGSGSADTEDDDDSFGFGESAQSDDNLDFSSLEISEDEEPASIEVDTPQVEAAPALEPMQRMDEARPASAKGPQRGGAKGRGVKKGRKVKKQSGPLRSIITFLFLLMLVIGGGLYGLLQMGFWSGDFAELPNVDYVAAGQTAYDKAMVEVNKLIGNEAALLPAGSITVTEMGGKYIQNDTAGNLFIITGKVRNDYTSNRSAIAVQGMLYDTAGSAVNQQKVFCGNSIDDKTLRSAKVEELKVRGTNEFGDSLSNLDVAPGAVLPFTIVFSNLPENLSEYNVVPADSAAGAKQ